MTTTNSSKSKNKNRSIAKATKKVDVLPINIPIQEGVLLKNGTMLVSLPTLALLEQFWSENKHRFEFACRGYEVNNPIYLKKGQWIFGSSRTSVVHTLMRWDEVAIQCVFYEFSKNKDSMHHGFFEGREQYRVDQIQKGCWLKEDENAYQEDCIRRNPQNYHGYWMLTNLPNGMSNNDLFSAYLPHEELTDPKMPIELVKEKLQEQLFTELQESPDDEMICLDRSGIETELRLIGLEEKDERDSLNQDQE